MDTVYSPDFASEQVSLPQPADQPPHIKYSPIVRVHVVERQRILHKIDINHEDEGDGLLEDVYDDIVQDAAVRLLQKELDEAEAKEAKEEWGNLNNIDPTPEPTEDECITAESIFTIESKPDNLPEETLLTNLVGLKMLSADIDDLLDTYDAPIDFPADPLNAELKCSGVYPILKEGGEVERIPLDEQTAPVNDVLWGVPKTEAHGIPDTAEQTKARFDGAEDIERIPIVKSRFNWHKWRERDGLTAWVEDSELPEPVPIKEEIKESKMPDTMPDTPKVAQNKNGSLQFLKSVEGRVLTVLEAALPDKEHRNAVKTLIKKEFRREMNKVNRIPDDEGDIEY